MQMKYVWVVLGLVFICLSAQLSFDLPIGAGIPITGQSFAVLIVGYLLGKKEGTLTVILYLFLGILGLPVFAEGKAGIEVVQSGSGGFLIGFVAGAFVMGKMAESSNRDNLLYLFISMLLGTFIIVAIGLMKLQAMYGMEKALEYGFYPFWKGGIIKSALAALAIFVYYRLNKGVHRKNGT